MNTPLRARAVFLYCQPFCTVSVPARRHGGSPGERGAPGVALCTQRDAEDGGSGRMANASSANCVDGNVTEGGGGNRSADSPTTTAGLWKEGAGEGSGGTRVGDSSCS